MIKDKDETKDKYVENNCILPHAVKRLMVTDVSEIWLCGPSKSDKKLRDS